MAKHSPSNIKQLHGPAEPDLSEAASAVFAAVTALLKPLPPIQQEVLLTRLGRLRPANATPRAGTVLGAVVNLLEYNRDSQKEWSVCEIRERVASDQHVRAKPREVFNAIAYLARRGRVKQVGYGRYLLLDYGVIVETVDD